MPTRRRLLELSAACVFAPAVIAERAQAQAQGWPNRIVRMILPFAPAAAPT
jgi:tripartite-type tricarboxylate transporter receptor subunit TctC